jgi:hypothetical protein
MILYLQHRTNVANLSEIIKHQYLLTKYERIENNIKAYGLNLPDNNKICLNEFPGLYLDFETESDTNIYLGENSVVFIFPKDILQFQKNYHINLVDSNGFFIETLTYFPENVNNIPIQEYYTFCDERNIERPYYNEVIFHDKLSIHLASYILFGNEYNCSNYKEQMPETLRYKCHVFNQQETIEPKLLKNQHQYLDTTSKACRVYVSNYRYDGIPYPLFFPYNKNIKYKSSLEYVKTIARKAGITENKLKKFRRITDLEAYMESKNIYTKTFLNRKL